MILFPFFSFFMVLSRPSCENCYFFHKMDNGQLLCKKYGEKNDLKGKIDFYNALLCRTDELRCGTSGKHFLKKNESMVR